MILTPFHTSVKCLKVIKDIRNRNRHRSITDDHPSGGFFPLLFFSFLFILLLAFQHFNSPLTVVHLLSQLAVKWFKNGMDGDFCDFV